MSGACQQNYISLLTRSIAILHNKLKPLYLHYQNTYVTKLGGLVTYYENLLPIVLWQNNYIALRNHMVNKNHHISTTAMLPATKFREVLIYNRELFSINSHVPSNMWSCEVIWNVRFVISLLLAKTVTYYEKLIPINSHNSLSMWSCEVTYYPLTHCIWLPQLA